MPKQYNTTVIEVLLISAYRRAIKDRCKKVIPIKIPVGIAHQVAEELGDPKLAKLFIKSQFHYLPVDFCREKFKRSYPPANVVFGGNCWYRYERYLERGINDGS